MWKLRHGDADQALFIDCYMAVTTYLLIARAG
jgi:hypothetical protein